MARGERDVREPIAGEGDERRYWASVDSSHKRAIVIALALIAVAAGVGGVWLAVRAGRGQDARDLGGPARVIGGPPADVATGSSVATGSASVTGSAGAIAGAAATGTAAASFTRAAKVAYRKDGWLWVAGEDGTGAKKVAQAAAGSFALSPDAATLAYEDSAHSLRLAPAGGGDAKNAGPMSAGSRIAWAPSSAWLAYGAATGVRRVNRDGSAGAPLIAGVAPAVSADGVRVGVVQARAGLPDALAFADSKGGPVGAVTGAEHPETFAWLDARRVAVVVRGLSVQGGTEYSIGVAEVPGGTLTAVTTHEAEARAVPAAMCASPDGRHVAWADQGDDGWSRTYLLDTQGGSPVLASKRYDTYPLCWSADGKRLFLIEGNAWQGQATRLVSLSADATDKRVIVEGAGL